MILFHHRQRVGRSDNYSVEKRMKILACNYAAAQDASLDNKKFKVEIVKN
jgi:hypothetical protein